MVKKILVIAFWFLFIQEGFCQKPFAKVYLNKKYVFVQQPIQVTIKVYSPTWFTQGVEFGDLKVKDAFIIPFTNSVSGNEAVGGKNYAVISHYFLLFPYKTGALEFPSLTMTAYVPPPGDYEGKPTPVKTRSIQFKAKALPKSKYPSFLASRVYLQDYWNKDFKKLKVGDVVERTVKVTAVKTIANFIPNVTIDSVTYAKKYANNNLTDQNINSKKETLISTRTETFSYLFTKAGDFEMPGASISYFSPYTGEYKTIKSEPTKIHVDTTSDLGIVASIADSLSMLNQPMEINKEPKKSLKEQVIEFIVTYKYKLGIVFLLFITFRRIIKGLQSVFNYYRKRREQYLLSEKYAFKLALKEGGKENIPSKLDGTYRWLLHPKLNKISITQTSKEINDEVSHSFFIQLFHDLSISSGKSKIMNYKKNIIELRKKLMKRSKSKPSHLKKW
ncbi:BatD family protein [Flammeovirga agarivorans]|uniref:Protein BatD n=1 Tax=Flammeovirga agarivorans TaxID=2726742 RepID=A0A7X8SKJ5_9BACT|nr:BatD family protein [Flammeovirga agarivorans]NLR91950.1 protein BatD [Flammeovirga agarivorans]